MNTTLLFTFGFPELVLAAFFGLIPLALMIYSLFDIAKSNFRSSNLRSFWIILVLFTPVLGSLIYLMVGRGQRINK